MEIVEVETAGGVPVSFMREGRTWHVGAQPVRWFERIAWWETEQRMPRGQGRTDVAVWQVQARIGHNPRTPLVTFQIVQGDTWTCRSMQAVAA